jgi:hydrogenase maturation protease
MNPKKLKEECLKAKRGWKVIAIGNPLKEDDAIALRLAESEELAGFEIVKAETVPENFVSPGDRIVLIDAIHFPGESGEVRLFSKDEIEELSSSSHNLTPLILKITAEVELIGIKPASTGYSDRLSPELQAKFGQIKQNVAALLREIVSKE